MPTFATLVVSQKIVGQCWWLKAGRGENQNLDLPSRPGSLFAALPANSSVIKVANRDEKLKLRKELRGLAVQVDHSSPGLPYRQSRKSAATRVSLSRRLPVQTPDGRAVPADRVV